MEYHTIAVVTNKEASKVPYPYVYVNRNGSFRELDQNEKEYLETKFHGNDGGRPYIKGRYSSRTPDGKLYGFLKRTKLPKGVKVGELPPPRKWWQIWY